MELLTIKDFYAEHGPSFNMVPYRAWITTIEGLPIELDVFDPEPQTDGDKLLYRVRSKSMGVWFHLPAHAKVLVTVDCMIEY